MKITENNYEAWLLDHLEGRLDAGQTALLRRFLNEHPELEADTSLELLSIAPCDETAHSTFHHLRKPEGSVVPTASLDASNYEEAFAAFHEGDLDQQQEDGLRRFVAQNPVLANEFELFGKLTTEPDKSIVYPDKAALRRHKRVPLLVRWSIPVSVAAAIALIVMFYPSPRDPNGVGSANEPLVALNKAEVRKAIPAASMAPDRDNSAAVASASVPRDLPAKPVAPAITPPREKIQVTGLQSIAAKTVVPGQRVHRTLIEGSRYYTCLYADIRLRDQIQFQQEVEQQGLQTIYGDAKAEAGKNTFDLWTIARLGVKGFNYITKSDFEFTKARDDEGNVTDFAIGGEAIRVAHSSK